MAKQSKKQTTATATTVAATVAIPNSVAVQQYRADTGKLSSLEQLANALAAQLGVVVTGRKDFSYGTFFRLANGYSVGHSRGSSVALLETGNQNSAGAGYRLWLPAGKVANAVAFPARLTGSTGNRVAPADVGYKLPLSGADTEQLVFSALEWLADFGLPTGK